jgi:hypothetical protein
VPIHRLALTYKLIGVDVTKEERKIYNKEYKRKYRLNLDNILKAQEYDRAWHQANKEKRNKYKRDKRAALNV